MVVDLPPHPERRDNVFPRQAHHEVHIFRVTEIPMRIHGHPANDEKMHPGVVQRTDDGLETGDFHAFAAAAGMKSPSPKCAP